MDESLSKKKIKWFERDFVRTLVTRLTNLLSLFYPAFIMMTGSLFAVHNDNLFALKKITFWQHISEVIDFDVVIPVC